MHSWNEIEHIRQLQSSTSKLHCWCAEAGKCECEQDICNPVDCACVAEAVEYNAPIAFTCSCVLFPTTQDATGYLTNTHDVLRRGAH